MTTVNMNVETGIHYGVIHQNEVMEAWCDSSEPDYGNASCPKCGDDAQGITGAEQDYCEQHGDDAELEPLTDYSRSDYGCAKCGIYFDSDEAFADEPNGFILDDGEYKASSDNYGDIFIVSSPYYTRAQFCSPCAPGAVYLMNPNDEGVKGYCFGHDWFDDGKAPYKVYKVSDDSLVID